MASSENEIPSFEGLVSENPELEEFMSQLVEVNLFFERTLDCGSFWRYLKYPLKNGFPDFLWFPPILRELVLFRVVSLGIPSNPIEVYVDLDGVSGFITTEPNANITTKTLGIYRFSIPTSLDGSIPWSVLELTGIVTHHILPVKFTPESRMLPSPGFLPNTWPGCMREPLFPRDGWRFQYDEPRRG